MHITATYVVKLLFVGVKVVIISYLLIKGLIQHWKSPKRNYQVIALLFMYQIFLILLTIAELIVEYIPLIYLILCMACSS